MAVAHDAVTRYPATGDGDFFTPSPSDRSFSHAPSGTPAGVVVVILKNGTVATEGAAVTGVTYGGIAMTLRQAANDNSTTADGGQALVYTLTDQSIPTGAQTVVLQGCISDNAATSALLATCITVTSATGQTTVDNSNQAIVGSGANPTVSVTTTQDTLLYGGFHHGASSFTGTVTSGTTELVTTGYGANSGRICRSTAVRSSGSNSIGYTFGTSDNYGFAVVALAEKAGDANPNAGEISITSSANNITSQVGPSAENVAITASANNATVTVANFTNVQAQVAGATSNAQNAQVSVQIDSTYDAVVKGDTPVSFWSDATGTDAIGLQNLTKFNTPATGTAPDGSTCMVFDGINQYAEGADQDAYSVPTTGRLTYEAWIRPDVLEFPNDEAAGYVHWAGKSGNGTLNDAEWQMRMYSKTNTEDPPRPNRISGYAYNPTGGLGAGGYFEDPIALGEWIHVVFVINKADAGGSYPDGYGKLYKNGVLRRQDNLFAGGVPLNPGNGPAPMRVGASRGLDSFFKGAIAKSAIYNYELSQAQITEHFNTMELAQGLAQDAATNVAPLAQGITVSASANNATVTTAGNDTNVNAQLASASATAVNPQIQVFVNAGGANATSGEPGGVPDAQVASAVATALNAQITITTNAANATGAGAALSASVAVSATAGDAVTTALGQAGSTSSSGSAGSADANGVAEGSTTRIAPVSTEATSAASVENATVSTTGGTDAQAQVVSVVGAAENASIKVSPTSVSADSAGTAQNTTGITGTTGPVVATGAAIAEAPQIKIFVNGGTAEAIADGAQQQPPSPDAAFATGVAFAPQVEIRLNASNATAACLGQDATVTTGSTTNAQAQVASSAGAAENASIKVSPVNTSADSAGAAQGVTARVFPGTGVATGAGVAENAVGSTAGNTQVFPSIAGATGQAVNASVSTSETGEAIEAAVTGQALNASVSTSETGEAVVATATGSAHNAIVDFSIRANSQAASASGSANNATIKVSTNLGAAEVAALAQNAVGAITQYAFAQGAVGSGSANAPDVTRTGNAQAELVSVVVAVLTSGASIGLDGATALGIGEAIAPFKIAGRVEAATSVAAVRDATEANDVVNFRTSSTSTANASHQGGSGVFANRTSTSTVTD